MRIPERVFITLSGFTFQIHTIEMMQENNPHQTTIKEGDVIMVTICL